jgi:hypothetical protein
MTKQEQRALAAGFITLEDTLHGTEDALQHHSFEGALDQLRKTQHTIAEMRSETIDVAQAAFALEVSKPTIRTWARRGLMDIAGEHPMTLTFASVVALRRDLQRLRETATNEKRWQALLAAAADQRELAQPGAREGLTDALTDNTEPLTRT